MCFASLVGWMVAPKIYIHLAPMTVTLFEKGTFADIIKALKMTSS